MKPQMTRVAAYALITDADRILLCRLSGRVGGHAGSWTLPGGGIEFGEAPEAAMIREVMEETGLQVRCDGLVGVDSIVRGSDDRRFHGLRLLYDATVVGGELTAEQDGSTDLAAWIPLAAVATLPLVDLALEGVRRVTRRTDDRAHFILFVEDQDRAREFWTAALGVEATLHVPGMTELPLPGSAVLGLMPTTGIERLLEGRVRPSTSRVPRTELYLVVGDLDAAWDRALVAGATVVQPPALRDWGHEAGYLLCPDGHLFALARVRQGTSARPR